MLKFITIIGARPQFIKAAAISRVFKNTYAAEAEEILVHTGQHYDDNMSKVFFDQMEIPAPKYNLDAGSGSHGVQTGRMMMRLEEVLLSEKPDMVIVYGDTNSTMAGALTAAKLHIPVAHIEAGLRSFNKRMPEEINRIAADHVSTLLFSPTLTGIENLLREGFPENAQPPFSPDHPRIYHCGDVMYDNALYFSHLAQQYSQASDQAGMIEDGFILCTIHRDNNTDDPVRLNSLFRSLIQVSGESGLPVVLPLHPRTRKMMDIHLVSDLAKAVNDRRHFILTGPMSYLEMLLLEKRSVIILTDSGGVQKESYFFRKPCIVLRPESEWKELLDAGTTLLADADEERIIRSFRHFMLNRPTAFPPVFGDGKAAEFICREMILACKP